MTYFHWKAYNKEVNGSLLPVYPNVPGSPGSPLFPSIPSKPGVPLSPVCPDNPFWPIRGDQTFWISLANCPEKKKQK